VKRHAVIVREGSLLRAAGIGLSAIGLGLFFFLVCLGISFFNHNGLAERVDASLKKQTEDLSAAIKDGQRPDRTDEVMAKLDDAVRSLRSRIDDYNASTSQSIAHQLDVIQAQIYDLKSRSPIIVPPKTDKDDPKIIQTEVTVFISPNVANLSGALDKCIWWGGGKTQRTETVPPQQRPPRYQPLGDRWGRPL
jgi:hypothetical protein